MTLASSDAGPNILVIRAGAIDTSGLGCHGDSRPGARTPNIDRLACEGLRFTHYHAGESIAGSWAFSMGRSLYETGLSRADVPATSSALKSSHPTLAQLLRPLGYATAQFGTSHSCDRDESLPTLHGFDEFYGSPYHLDAQEDGAPSGHPSQAGLPGLGPCGARGIVHSWSDGNGGQRIEAAGPLTKGRIERLDEECAGAAIDFIVRQNVAMRPFFVWFSATPTRLRPPEHSVCPTGPLSACHDDAATGHDRLVGRLLDQLDRLGIAGNTLVVYTAAGPRSDSRLDAGATPRGAEKQPDREGVSGVPCLLRWPGHIPGGIVANDVRGRPDLLPEILEAPGEPGGESRLLHRYAANGR